MQLFIGRDLTFRSLRWFNQDDLKRKVKYCVSYRKQEGHKQLHSQRHNICGLRDSLHHAHSPCGMGQHWGDGGSGLVLEESLQRKRQKSRAVGFVQRNRQTCTFFFSGTTPYSKIIYLFPRKDYVTHKNKHTWWTAVMFYSKNCTFKLHECTQC